MKSTYEDMDNIIVQQTVAVANEKKSISVLFQDTDVFVLLIYHYLAQTRKLML